MIRLSRLTFALFVGGALVLGACGTAARNLGATAEPIHSAPAATVDETPPSAEAPAQTAVPVLPTSPAVATSRGPDLEASDPESAKLDSGSLQLVEFFRFT